MGTEKRKNKKPRDNATGSEATDYSFDSKLSRKEKSKPAPSSGSHTSSRLTEKRLKEYEAQQSKTLLKSLRLNP